MTKRNLTENQEAKVRADLLRDGSIRQSGVVFNGATISYRADDDAPVIDPKQQDQVKTLQAEDQARLAGGDPDTAADATGTGTGTTANTASTATKAKSGGGKKGA